MTEPFGRPKLCIISSIIFPAVRVRYDCTKAYIVLSREQQGKVMG